MEFQRKCAARLDEGESSEAVLKCMRERYRTVQCMSVRTSEVRALCRPSEEYLAARAKIVNTWGSVAEGVLCAWHDCARKCPFRVQEELPEGLRDALRTLPHRNTANVRALRVTRCEMLACKRLGQQSALEKNRARRRVDGAALLRAARDALQCSTTTCTLALALMLVTGRRTCEILNGASVFSLLAGHTYALVFAGQAKRKGNQRPYVVPVLVPGVEVVAAWTRLRRLQGEEEMDNRTCSRRYQSLLSRNLSNDDVWSACGRVHGLRGVYVGLALRLFDWRGTADGGDPSDAYVAMSILGHEGMTESLVYTTYDVGEGLPRHSLGLGPRLTSSS